MIDTAHQTHGVLLTNPEILDQQVVGRVQEHIRQDLGLKRKGKENSSLLKEEKQWCQEVYIIKIIEQFCLCIFLYEQFCISFIKCTYISRDTFQETPRTNVCL